MLTQLQSRTIQFLKDPLRIYKNYWIETGNATFLIDKLVDERVNLALIEKAFVDNNVLSSFDVGDISPIALLFQTANHIIHQIRIEFNQQTHTVVFDREDSIEKN